MKRQKLNINGWLNLWKPAGISSMQAVAKVRWLFDAAKAGHAGTLDPAADGILPDRLWRGHQADPAAAGIAQSLSFYRPAGGSKPIRTIPKAKSLQPLLIARRLNRLTRPCPVLPA